MSLTIPGKHKFLMFLREIYRIRVAEVILGMWKQEGEVYIDGVSWNSSELGIKNVLFSLDVVQKFR